MVRLAAAVSSLRGGQVPDGRHEVDQGLPTTHCGPRQAKHGYDRRAVLGCEPCSEVCSACTRAGGHRRNRASRCTASVAPRHVAWLRRHPYKTLLVLHSTSESACDAPVPMCQCQSRWPDSRPRKDALDPGQLLEGSQPQLRVRSRGHQRLGPRLQPRERMSSMVAAAIVFVSAARPGAGEPAPR